VAGVQIAEGLRHGFKDLEQQAHRILHLLVLEGQPEVPNKHLEHRLDE
jgi:hypothetical protein